MGESRERDGGRDHVCVCVCVCVCGPGSFGEKCRGRVDGMGEKQTLTGMATEARAAVVKCVCVCVCVCVCCLGQRDSQRVVIG